MDTTTHYNLGKGPGLILTSVKHATATKRAEDTFIGLRKYVRVRPTPWSCLCLKPAHTSPWPERLQRFHMPQHSERTKTPGPQKIGKGQVVQHLQDGESLPWAPWSTPCNGETHHLWRELRLLKETSLCWTALCHIVSSRQEGYEIAREGLKETGTAILGAPGKATMWEYLRWPPCLSCFNKWKVRAPEEDWNSKSDRIKIHRVKRG